MLIKNFKRTNVTVSSLNGQSARFAPGQEREVPESLVDECIKAGLIPADDFKQALLDAQAEESLAVADELASEATSEAVAQEAREKAIKEAELEAADELAAEKRSIAARKAAATRKANQSK